jgi:hypothetical protein
MTDRTGTFSADERAAMKERAQEVRRAAERQASREDGARDVPAKIDELAEPERTMARRIAEIVAEAAPDLDPKTWYGMPAWSKGGRTLCFFQSAAKFGTRYATLGFNDGARLDDGGIRPVAYAIADLSPQGEQRIADLVRRAAA